MQTAYAAQYVGIAEYIAAAQELAKSTVLAALAWIVLRVPCGYVLAQ